VRLHNKLRESARTFRRI